MTLRESQGVLEKFFGILLMLFFTKNYAKIYTEERQVQILCRIFNISDLRNYAESSTAYGTNYLHPEIIRGLMFLSFFKALPKSLLNF